MLRNPAAPRTQFPNYLLKKSPCPLMCQALKCKDPLYSTPKQGFGWVLLMPAVHTQALNRINWFSPHQISGSPLSVQSVFRALGLRERVRRAKFWRAVRPVGRWVFRSVGGFRKLALVGAVAVIWSYRVEAILNPKP